MQEHLFGLAKKNLGDVCRIQKGDKLFLYNFESDCLYGVYEAAGVGAENIEPKAWSGCFPAQVRVNLVDQLKEICNASKTSPFLRSQRVELSIEQTKELLKRFETAPTIGEFLFIQPPTIPNSEKLFAAFLDNQGIAYIRTSQEKEDFSNVLKRMKAKRPDFLLLTKGQIFFVEIKPNLVREEVPQIAIEVEEVQKLNQFQLQTGVETVIMFPLDRYGTSWKPLRPSWIVANGTVEEFQSKDYYVVNARAVEKIVLPLQLTT